MIRLRIVRANNTPKGCQGTLAINGIVRFTTLEREWLNNEPNKSCIPAGRYRCRWVDTLTSGSLDGKTLSIEDVPGRSLIRFHAANKMEDLLGCVGVGTNFEDESMSSALKVWIGRSAAAMYRFLSLCKQEQDIELEIINCFEEVK